MVDVKRVKLPGVGVLHTFVTDGGGKVGVITHRSGSSDLITFSDAEDGSKATKVALRLDDDEAHTLAELLGGTRITESLTNLDSSGSSSGSSNKSAMSKLDRNRALQIASDFCELHLRQSS